jgi:hypothetical protein
MATNLIDIKIIDGGPDDINLNDLEFIRKNLELDHKVVITNNPPLEVNIEVYLK